MLARSSRAICLNARWRFACADSLVSLLSGPSHSA